MIRRCKKRSHLEAMHKSACTYRVKIHPRKLSEAQKEMVEKTRQADKLRVV
jgi:hypothetical protein